MRLAGVLTEFIIQKFFSARRTICGRSRCRTDAFVGAGFPALSDVEGSQRLAEPADQPSPRLRRSAVGLPKAEAGSHDSLLAD